MHKVIEYKKRADEYRRRASQATDAQEKAAEERIAAAWELLATAREKQLKEGTIQPAFDRVQINEGRADLRRDHDGLPPRSGEYSLKAGEGDGDF